MGFALYQGTPYKLRESPCFVSGHGFSRAAKGSFFPKGTAFRPYAMLITGSALAAEGSFLSEQHFLRSLFSPCYGPSCMKSLSGNDSEQRTGVFRYDENQHKKAQRLKPRALLGLCDPTKVVP